MAVTSRSIGSRNCAFPLLVLPLILTVMTVAQLSINYDILINDKAYVAAQLKCVFGENKGHQCDKIGNRLLSLLPAVSQSGKCDACNDQEKIYIVKVAQLLKRNYTGQWEQLLNKYNVPQELRDNFLQLELQP